MSDIGLRESVSGPISDRSVEVVGVANRRRFTSEYKRCDQSPLLGPIAS